jgi:dienelactone hydrolase
MAVGPYTRRARGATSQRLPPCGPGVYTRPAMTLRRIRSVAVAWLIAGCAGAIGSLQVPVQFPRPATLTGDLYRPAGDGPFPALVLLHGCSGIQPNTRAWAEWLKVQGYVALALDSFSGRGLKRLCSDASPLTGQARATDVWAAAQYLKTLPFVDGARIGAIGWSHGGWTVLHSPRFDYLYPDVTLKALVAFYPACRDQAVYRGSIPLLILAGAEDNWTPAQPCEFLAESARRDGKDVTIVVYPGAHHGFDSAHVARPVVIADARRGAGATVAYNPRAHEDAEKQLKRFLDAKLKR